MKIGSSIKKLMSAFLSAAAAVSMTALPSVTSASAAVAALPSAVDNSTGANGKYFPEITDQGDFPSCVTHSSVYYQWTYTYNKAKGIETTDKNAFSVGFVFKNTGRSRKMDTVMNFLKTQGAATLEDAPFSGDENDPINQYSFYRQTNAYENAYKARLGGNYYIVYGKKYDTMNDYYANKTDDEFVITDGNDSDLQVIKKALADGEVFSFETNYSTNINKSTNHVKIKSTTESGIDNSVSGQWAIPYYKTDENGTANLDAHAMTMVGYNDNIWIDINDNGVVDPHEKGAFKIANSYGKDEPYSNGGFIWVAYDAVNQQSLVSGVDNSKRAYYPITCLNGMIYDKASCEAPLIYAKAVVNTADMYNADLKLKATDKNGNQIYFFSVASGFANSNVCNFAGGTGALDGNYIQRLDYDPAFTSDILTKYNWTVEASNASTNKAYPLTVKEFKIVDQFTGKEYKMASDKFTLAAGASKTFSVDMGNTPVPADTVTIYYKGYSNPYIHYQVEGGTWTAVPGAKMTATNEVDGYTHKYVIDLGTASKAFVCFNDGNNSWDSQNGANYTFTKGTFTYSAQDHKITPYDNTPAELSAQIGLSVSSVTVGSAVNVTASAKGGSAPYTYKYSYTKDGKETVILDNSSSANASFTPPVSGSYTVKVTVRDNTGNTSSAEKALVVNDKTPDNIVTIYYSGFSAPYIHYRAGTGTWTSPPGKPMQATGEVSGCTHKYTINIGTQSYAEVCFNDGKGSWDNNSGSNYKFNTGTYTFKNHVIQKYSDTPAALTASAALSTEKLVLGSNVSITASAFGGKAPYSYKITSEFDGKTDTLSSYSSVSAISYKPESTGTYKITVYVKDADGKVVSSAKTLTVEKKSANVVVVNYKGYAKPYIHFMIEGGSWTAVPGKAMTAVNDSSGYTHQYVIDLGTKSYAKVCFNDGGSNWQNNGGKDFTFVKGTYSINNGSQVGYDPTVYVTGAGAVNAPFAAINASTIRLGQSVQVSANAGNDCQYAFFYKKSTSSKWVTQQNYAKNSSVAIRPNVGCSYDICAKAKYSDGTVIKKYFTIHVTKPLTNTSKVTLSGKTATIRASSEGGSGTVQYAYYYRTAGTEGWKKISGYTAAKTKSITLKNGSYEFCIKAIDQNGIVCKVYPTVTVG